MLDAHGIERLINFQVNFYYIKALFNNRRINIYGVYILKKETSQKDFNRSNTRSCTTIISHTNSNKSNNMNTSNSDNMLETSKLLHIFF